MSDNQSDNSAEWYASQLPRPSAPPPTMPNCIHIKDTTKWNVDGLIYVKRCSAIPAVSHFAAIENTSYTTPGYDRGDPNDTVESLNYIALRDAAAVEAFVLRHPREDNQYNIIKVERVTIKKTVTVEIK